MSKQRQRPPPLAEQLKGLRGIDSRKVTRRINFLFQWIAFGLSQFALLDVLEYLGKFSILVAILFWLYEIPERRQAVEDARESKHYVAWQTINAAMNKPGNGGRSDALRDLVRDEVLLDGVSLSGAVIIGPLNLTNASMKYADFSTGHYERVSLREAIIRDATWKLSVCRSCSFRYSHMEDSLFVDARFENCKFQGAELSQYEFENHDFPALTHQAGFTNTSFWFCNFDNPEQPGAEIGVVGGAELYGYAGGLDGVRFLAGTNEDEVNDFKCCSFVGTSFSQAVWDSVDFNDCNFAFVDLQNLELNPGHSHMDRCNLYGATNASPDFLIWAGRGSLLFTNITTWNSWQQYVSSLQDSRPSFTNEFTAWASNQWMSFYHYQKSPQQWLDWSRINLTNAPDEN